MKTSKVTIKDIAKLADVSPTTVSLILNGKGDRFSEETIRSVKAIAKENHYVPDFYAKQLTIKDAKTIGVILPDLTDFFFGELLKGIEKVAYQEGYSVLLMHSEHSKEKEHQDLNIMLSRSVSGIILATPYEMDSDLFEQIKQLCPIILMDHHQNPRNEGIIYVDEKNGMRHAVEYLYEKGHRKIAFIKEDKSYYQLNDRAEGYFSKMKELNLFNPKLVIETDLSVEGGYFGACRLLDQSEDFTAVICANDHLAIGAYRAFSLAGKKIPEDFSVIGFDNIDIAPYLSPALTTVKQPIHELGEIAARRLIEKMNHPEEAIKNSKLNTTLCIRESVCDLNQFDSENKI